MKDSRNIVGLIAFCALIVFYFFYKEYQKKEPERIQENNLNVNFSGKIDSIYRDYSNHGVTVLILTNKKRVEFNMYEFSYFKKNDSIIKQKGKDSVYVYRNGEVKAYKY